MLLVTLSLAFLISKYPNYNQSNIDGTIIDGTIEAIDRLQNQRFLIEYSIVRNVITLIKLMAILSMTV